MTSRKRGRKRKSPEKDDDVYDGSSYDTGSVPEDLVGLVKQKKICDLRVLDTQHITNCIKLYEEDVYYAAAVQVVVTTVLEGGAVVKIGKLNYPNFKKVERNSLEIQLSKMIPWFMTLGFCLFSYDNPNYIPRVERMKMRYLKRSMRLQRKEHDMSMSDENNSDSRPTDITYMPYSNNHVAQSLVELENNPHNSFFARETKSYKQVIDEQIDGTYKKDSDGSQTVSESEKKDELEKAKQINMEDDFTGGKEKEYRKLSSAMKHVEFPGISSIEARNSNDILEGLNPDGNNNPLYKTGNNNGITDQAFNMLQQQDRNSSMPSSSNEDNTKRTIPSAKKFPLFEKARTGTTDIYRVDKISQFAINDPAKRLDASNGDLDFVVPDMDSSIGSFIRYRDLETGSVKVFFVPSKEDSDDESEGDSSSSESDGDDYMSDDGFDYGTASHEEDYETPGYGLSKNYVTYPNKRRKRIGNQYDFPNRIQDESFAYHSAGTSDPYTTTQMEPLEKNTAEIKSKRIAETLMKEGVVNGHDIVLRSGQYMPDETADVYLGVRTNIKPIGNRVKAYPNSEGNMGTSSRGSSSYDDSEYEEGEIPISKLTKRELERKFRRTRKADIIRQKRTIAKQKKIYMVYTFSPPSIEGNIVSNASKLLGSFTRIANAENYDTVYHHRCLWPTAVLEDVEDKQSESKTQKKNVEASEIKQMAQKILQSVKTEEISAQGLRAHNTVSESTMFKFADKLSQEMKSVPVQKEPPNKQSKIPLPAELVHNNQIKKEFHMKALQIMRESSIYKEAYDNNALSSISPDLSFRMNAFYVPEGYVFKSFSSPPPPISVSDVEESHVKKVCTIFGVPKRLLDNVEQTKFKPDTASEIQPMIKRLLPIRKAIKSFFSGFYISKNGVIVSEAYKRLNQFIKEETIIVDKIIEKILELGNGLGFFVGKSLDEFVNNQRKELSNKKEMEKRETALQKLESEVKEASLKDQKSELAEREKERKNPKKSGSGDTGPKKKESQTKQPAGQQTGQKSQESGEKESDKSKSSSESNTTQFDLSEVEIKPHEKQRNLLIIQKTIEYGKQILADLTYTVNYVENYQVGAIMLEFPTPMVGDLQTLQQIQEVSPLPGNEIKDFILTSHGVG